MYTSSDVADRIKEVAKLRGMTVKQVLERASLGRNMMTMMRTSMPKADNLAKIADVLDCSVDYLLERDERQISTDRDFERKKSPSVSEEDQQLLSSFHKLDEKDQYKALGYIDSLLSAEKYLPKDGFKNA